MSYHTQAAEALMLARSQRYREAITPLRRLIQQNTSVADEEYDAWLVALAESLHATGAYDAAGYVRLYLLDFDAAYTAFSSAQSPINRALCCERRGAHEEAATLYKSQRRWGHAAASLEEVSPERAVSLWLQRRAEIDAHQEPYAYALSVLNLAYCQKKTTPGDPGVRRLLIEALGYLEGLASEYEQQGMIDEALDCYHMIIQIGQEQHAFENLSEGYINAVRLLTERGRVLTALRYYAGIGEVGREWGEQHAVATLFQEAAEMVQRAGMLYGPYYIQRAGEAWLEVVASNIDRGIPAEMTENALLAALDCYNRLDDVEQIHSCYEQLSRLPIDEAKTQRYARLSQQASNEHRTKVEVQPPSDLLLRAPRLVPLWREDLLMWEVGTEPVVMISNVVWDLSYHDTVRRQVLNLMLNDLDEGTQRSQGLLLGIARGLASIVPKQAFQGLKRLLTSGNPELRAEVMHAAGRLDHPCGLTLVEEGLLDDSKQVRDAALGAIERHHRSEDFDGLKQLFERFDDPEVRRRVIVSVGKLRTFEAVEFLYRLLVSGGSSEVLMEARRSLKRILNPEWTRLLRNRAKEASESAQARLGSLLSAG